MFIIYCALLNVWKENDWLNEIDHILLFFVFHLQMIHVLSEEYIGNCIGTVLGSWLEVWASLGKHVSELKWMEIWRLSDVWDCLLS